MKFSFIDCILDNTDLTRKQREEIVRDYENLRAQYTLTMGDLDAATAAAQRYAATQESIYAQKNKNNKRDVLAFAAMKDKLDRKAEQVKTLKRKASKGTKWLWWGSSRAHAARNMLEGIFTRHQAEYRRASLSLWDGLEKYRSKRAGFSQDIEGFKDIVRDLIDGTNKTSGEATPFRAVLDMLRDKYEGLGGVLGRLPGYFPQRHNPNMVARAGYEKWLGDTLPKLDREKMVDFDTGLPMDTKSLIANLKEVYESITTNGLDEFSKMAETGQRFYGHKALAEKRSKSRFLHFKDAESYMQYNRDYGTGDAGLFDNFVNYIESITRDIAIMEEMGPKASANMERLLNLVAADGGSSQDMRTLQGMYDVLSGRTGYGGALPTWYRAVQNTQNWLRSSYLGSAPVSALSDTFYLGWTAKMNGMKATKAIGEYTALLNPKNKHDRQIARRIAFTASAVNGNSLAQAKWMDDAGGTGVTAWMASFTNRASGLAVMTDSTRHAITLNTMGFFSDAKARKVPFEELHENMRAAFDRWDMGKEDYENILASDAWVDADTKADFLRPEDVAAAGFSETARKYEMWLVDMAQKASNEPTLLTRAITTGAVLGDASRGTALRATASSVMMFKSFGLTVIQNHLLPALRHAATARGWNRMAHLMPVIVGTTMMGALAIQARQLISGKTPKDADDPKFWMSAMMQGGGLGIFGDFMLQDYSRFGQDMATTLLGPMYGLTRDTFKAFKGNFDRALDSDQESKFFADVYQFAERNIPMARLWYTRLLLERGLLDQAERMIDPNFDTRMRRIEGKMKKAAGQEFWWAPGDLTPQQ